MSFNRLFKSLQKKLFFILNREMADRQTSLNIVLVGKTGHGKSSTGNSLLNRDVFSTELSMDTINEDFQLECSIRGDVKIRVVDTPGVIDTKLTAKELYGKLQNVMSLFPDGFNAFIFVLNIAARFTAEELKTLDILKGFFGPDFLKICIIVFTHGDTFYSKNKSMSFEDWVQQQQGPFADFLNECGNRVILISNINMFPDSEEKRQISIDKLLNMIRENNMLYLNENFSKASHGRTKLVLQEKLPQLQSKYQVQISLLMAEVEKVQKNINELNKDGIDALKEQGQRLLSDIEDDDKGTEMLIDFKNQIITVNRLIDGLETLQEKAKESEIVSFRTIALTAVRKFVDFFVSLFRLNRQS